MDLGVADALRDTRLARLAERQQQQAQERYQQTERQIRLARRQLGSMEDWESAEALAVSGRLEYLKEQLLKVEV